MSCQHLVNFVDIRKAINRYVIKDVNIVHRGVR